MVTSYPNTTTRTLLLMLLLCITRTSVHSFAPTRVGVISSLQVSRLSVAAVSSTTQTIEKYSRSFHPSLSKRVIGTALFGEIGSEEEPSTGWLHNQPRPEFQQDQENLNIQDNDHPKEELRTGWLHRTESRSEEEAVSTSPSSLRKQSSSTTTASSITTSDVARRLLDDMSRQQRNHRIITPPTLHPSGEEGRTIVITEHKIAVPLRRDTQTFTSKKKNGDLKEDFTPEVLNSDKPTVDIFFTVVDLISTHSNRAADVKFFHSLNSMPAKERATAYVRHHDLQDMSKGFLYLQGGPGFGAPPPISGIGLTSKSSWAGAALSNGFKKIIFMDQRGTGRSTPITKQTLQKRFPELFALDDVVDEGIVNHDAVSDTLKVLREKDGDTKVDDVCSAIDTAVEYMSNFRADNIVHDAEEVKTALMMPATSKDPRPWGGALGQSFGGFCMMSYLSLVANPPSICLFTGGIAPMLAPVQDVYSSLWERVKDRSLTFYKRYPGDIAVVKRIVKHLLDNPATLPSGGILTARRFLQLGMSLGGPPSSFASMHNTFATAFIDEDPDNNNNELSRAFLKHVDSAQPFDDYPIYFLLHESIYADGAKCSPTKWAAHLVFEQRTGHPSEFSYKLTAALDSDERPTLFFGEMVFPWMADGDYKECSGLGMKALAHGLAEKEDWIPLYNADNMRNALSPVEGSSVAAAAVYTDDMYVDYDECRKVTKTGGPLEECKLYVTNEYQHSGLRDDGSTIFTKLLNTARGSIGVPS